MKNVRLSGITNAVPGQYVEGTGFTATLCDTEPLHYITSLKTKIGYIYVVFFNFQENKSYKIVCTCIFRKQSTKPPFIHSLEK